MESDAIGINDHLPQLKAAQQVKWTTNAIGKELEFYIRI
jgi:hypothetical protein